MGRVVVLGSLNQDLHLRLDRLPGPGETVLAGDLEHRFGGKGANQAVAAALAGAPTVLVGAVGDDAAGQAYRERLAAFGVDVARVRAADGVPTGTAVVGTDRSGENMIIVAPGANAAVTTGELAVLDELGPDDVLLTQLELPHDVVSAGVRAAAQRGARVVLNLAPFAALPADVLALADPVVVNEHEAQLLADADLAPPSVLTTLGRDGSRWGDDAVPAVPVEAVDTTGAGDAYCGTLAARLAVGDPPAAAMRAASEAAARCVAHPGAQPEVP